MSSPAFALSTAVLYVMKSLMNFPKSGSIDLGMILALFMFGAIATCQI